MKKKEYLQKCYGQAVQFLPARFRGCAMQLEDSVKERAQEFRLRAGQLLTVVLPEGEVNVKNEGTVRHEELNGVIDYATGGSVHSAEDSIKRGFITVSGGHRIGICGRGVVKNNELTFIKDVSSLSIRIAKEFHGIAGHLKDKVMDKGNFRNTLIISPPGCGKTTMLRDLIRVLSADFRICVSDERGEIAAKYKGVAQFDLGPHTDIMEGIDKSTAIITMLRAMSPQIIAVDEITADVDIKAMEYASNCGVGLLATVHAENVASLFEKPLYRRLIELGIFDVAVILSKNDGVFTTEVEQIDRMCGVDVNA